MEEIIYDRLCQFTGPRRNQPIHDHRLYGSYHFEKFNKPNAWRNTLTRFDEFLVPNNLDGQTIFDFGSCIGAISFECIRRNALQVTGFEYTQERVDVSNQLAEYLQVNDKMKFIQMDIDNQDINEFTAVYGKADIVFCCALDRYINKERLYKFVSMVTKNICYFETNSQIPVNDFKELMYKHGFNLIISIGMSQSDPNPERHSYILQKEPTILNSKHNVYLQIAKNMVNIDNIIYKLNNYVVYQYNDAIYNHIKKTYDKIKDIEYVQQMSFHYPHIVSPFYEHQLSKYTSSLDEKNKIRNDLVNLVKKLNLKGISHRDIHTRNLYFHQGRLKLCDWEVACENVCNIKECYDLTGTGIPGYEYEYKSNGTMKHVTDNCHVFMKHVDSVSKYLDTLKIDDFLISTRSVTK